MGTLTVREDLRFSAALAAPSERKDEKIERLIQELGLSKVADSRVTNQTHLHLTDYMCNSPPANNNPLLFVHEIISNNQKELYCQGMLKHTSQLQLYPKTVVELQEMIMKGLLQNSKSVKQTHREKEKDIYTHL